MKAFFCLLLDNLEYRYQVWRTQRPEIYVTLTRLNVAWWRYDE